MDKFKVSINYDKNVTVLTEALCAKGMGIGKLQSVRIGQRQGTLPLIKLGEL